ncbi:hypothetical protein HPB48_023807 [Haemaphysalis longicornis]|uniref:SH3 domain-containing protein n=1 Tax=Haemaphysalis longicornis TaxID=44386 RepID=A0A9J6H8K7_HAELO|nr:hypothetical protein HPB48_023807 [Haemaphysalis longicornis]
MSSVDLPDDNEKSLSSASTSPCPSPLAQEISEAGNPHRLLADQHLRGCCTTSGVDHQDELDLKAGDTVTVIDTTDPDWWQGKCLGRVGFFPSKYVAKLHSGERALQVLHSIQVMDGQEPVKLLRDQIVIQVADEMDGKVLVRTGLGDKALPCPLKYLQEVPASILVLARSSPYSDGEGSETDRDHRFVTVSWYIRASEIPPSQQAKIANLDYFREVLFDDRGLWSDTVDAEAIFGKCCVVTLPTDVSPDVAFEMVDAEGNPLFLCRWKFNGRRIFPALASPAVREKKSSSVSRAFSSHSRERSRSREAAATPSRTWLSPLGQEEALLSPGRQPAVSLASSVADFPSPVKSRSSPHKVLLVSPLKMRRDREAWNCLGKLATARATTVSRALHNFSRAVIFRAPRHSFSASSGKQLLELKSSTSAS